MRNWQEMKTLAAVAAEPLRRRLQDWRKANKQPARIPDEFFVEAAELAAEHGMRNVSEILGLSHGRIKRSRDLKATSPQTRPAKPQDTLAATFVQLVGPLSRTSMIPECVLEVESNRGARLRIALKDVCPMALATIIREFSG